MGREGYKPPPTDDDASTADSLLRAIARAPERSPSSTRRDPVRLAQFQIMERLGAGGMGVVYLARDEKLQRNVALKVLPAAFEADPERRRRFVREARSAAAITHPNIATVYEVGDAAERLFIAMELVEGETLRSRLSRGPLPLDESMLIARQLLAALARAHDRGVVHCDLKPDNVMIDGQGHVKVLDFGLAKLRETEWPEPTPAELGVAETALSPTEEGRLVGTPGYMAPEQAKGAAVDARTDLFSFGVILYEMLAGVRPFAGNTPFEVLVAVERDLPAPIRNRNPDVPPELEAVVARCLAKARDERFASAADVLDALSSVEPGAVFATTGPRRPPSSRAPRSRRWWVGAALVSAVPVIAFGARALIAKQDAASLVTSSAPASARPRPIGLLDHPPPATKSAEAAAAYRRALTDLRDAVRPPQTALERAVEFDPEFAAAHLRLSMARTQPGSKEAFREAVRFRENLDARDKELLHAEEPVAAFTPPDLVEAERRYAALLETRPRDIEVLARLATLRGRRDPAAARADFRALLELDPTLAGSELLAARNAEANDGASEASAHYQRCLELSPMAARCVHRLARLRASNGRCDAYARDITRVLVLEPEDWYYRLDGLSAALSTGASEDDIRAALEGVLAAKSVWSRPTLAAHLEAEIALWRGAFLEAKDAFGRAETLARQDAHAEFPPWYLPQRLAIAEELGDEGDVRAITRAYVGARALSTEAFWDGVVLSALSTHRVLPDDAIAKLRDRWRMDATDLDAGRRWLMYDALLARDEAEARSALTLHHAPISQLAPDLNAQLGHVLFVAGQHVDAASRLELAAFNCALFLGDEEPHIHRLIPAAYELGRVREGLGDVEGACGAYRRVLDRWGNATPRSNTAENARARWRALHCNDE